MPDSTTLLATAPLTPADFVAAKVRSILAGYRDADWYALI